MATRFAEVTIRPILQNSPNALLAWRQGQRRWGSYFTLIENVMRQLRYYSVIPNDKPEWLLRLQLDINIEYGLQGIEDTPEAWEQLRAYTDTLIQQMYCRRDIRIQSEVSTELRSDAGRTVLWIKRNKKVIQIYYIQ